MKRFFLLASVFIFTQNDFAQIQTSTDSYNSSIIQTETKRERREQAFAKLLEGQRFLWGLSRQRSQAALKESARAAKESLQKAVELDPTLAEAYTALSELALSAPPSNLDDALLLANIAVKINHDSYGGHRILARLYTIKSSLNRGDLNQEFAVKAINEWREIARLDARNPEAYAFLSEYYAKANNGEERIKALRNWIAAAAPLDARFYQTMMGAQAELTTENATVKLGAALLDDGQTAEAIGILSRVVADNPENAQAIELLREAVETSTDKNSSDIAVQSLTQAVFANPENAALVTLLAQIQARAGRVEEAAKVLRASAEKLTEKDKIAAANLHVALGDIYADGENYANALGAYETALSARGVNETEAVRDDERDFAIRVFEKMIQVLKKANRAADAKNTIERARRIFGKEDLFADRQLITFYRETGKNTEALTATRALRARNADDYGLLRLEATILTDDKRVDEAVALVKPLIGKKISVVTGGASVKADAGGTMTVLAPMYDDFTNYLFISNLYSQAGRGREAVEAANQAVAAGQNEDRKQIAKLSLATAQQKAGDNSAAEGTLRALIKQSPGNPIALNNLGYFLIERNANFQEALNLIEQAVKIDPTNPSYLDSLGWTYFKLENLERAEKYLKDALKFDASSATIHEHLGDVYQKQGKTELAKSVWRKSLALASAPEQISRLNGKIKTGK